MLGRPLTSLSLQGLKNSRSIYSYNLYLNIKLRHITYKLNKNNNNIINNNINYILKFDFHKSPQCFAQDMTSSEKDRYNQYRSDELKLSNSDEKINSIVNDIAQLNLLEVSELINALKTKLNLPDTAMMGSISTLPNNMEQQQISSNENVSNFDEKVEEEEKQTIFDVVLKSYNSESKVAVIKEVRQLLKLDIKSAKALVDKVPSILQSQCPKTDADEIVSKLEAVGAQIVLE